jgi:hypothetical protein
VALKWIIGMTPVGCSVAAFALTYLGKIIYSERLARLSIDESKDSRNNNKGIHNLSEIE